MAALQTLIARALVRLATFIAPGDMAQQLKDAAGSAAVPPVAQPQGRGGPGPVIRAFLQRLFG